MTAHSPSSERQRPAPQRPIRLRLGTDRAQVEPVGGVARFATVMDRFKDENPVVLFSGDALNPSILSQARPAMLLHRGARGGTPRARRSTGDSRPAHGGVPLAALHRRRLRG